MALSDKLKDLRSKAEEAVVERKDQINQAVQKAGDVADQRTGGKYHEQIQRAGGKAVGMLESLEGAGEKGAAGAAADHASPDPSATPAAAPVAEAGSGTSAGEDAPPPPAAA